MSQKIEDASYARSEIIRSAWVADFPSPETFLWMFYGASVPPMIIEPSFPNTTRYSNPKFDALFNAGRSAKTLENSYADFSKAEELLMKDAPIMVLWYDENYRLFKSNVHDLWSNPMRYRDYSKVYLKNFQSASIAKVEKK
jgi:peptide/nickel transport system substrate-binding protein